MAEEISMLRADFPIEYTSRVVNALQANMPELEFSQGEIFVRKPRYARRHRLLELHIPMPIDPLIRTRFVEVVQEYSYNLAFISKLVGENVSENK